MRGDKRDPFRFRSTMLRAVIGSLFLIVVALLCLWWSGVNENHSWAPVINTVGVTTLTIGATQIIMDVLVRQSLVQEMLSAVGIRDRVNAVGITDVQGGERFDWEHFIQRARAITVYASNPQFFLQQVWPHILRNAAQSSIVITVISEGGSDTARSEFTSTMEKDWKARSAMLKNGSRISIYETAIICKYGYLETDENLAIVMDPLNDAGGFNSTVVHAYSTGQYSEARTMFSEPIRIFESQVMREAGPLFADTAGRSVDPPETVTNSVNVEDPEIESLSVPMDKKGE